MADFAVGLSKTVVEAVVNKIKTAIKEEGELLQTVERDLLFITDEFDMMQSFLSSADGERIKNNVVRTWVRQVRDLSYDTEDCIESVHHLDTERSFQTLWHRLLASFKPGAELPLDTVVAEIKLLKARVEDVSQRNMRYNLIGDSGSKPMVQMEQTAAVSTRKIDILIEARNAAKMSGGISDLAGLISNQDCSDHRLHVMSVWGTRDDLGTKSIVKEAYDDPEIYKSFRHRAWVKLVHPFNPHKFVQSLVTQFYANSCSEQVVIDGDVLTWVEATQSAHLMEVFAKQVNEERYLVVLEDLSSIAEWHAVRTYLPDTNNRSSIVISTQQLEVASSCIGHPYQVLELNHISDSHSVCVFFKEGLQRDEVGSSFRLQPANTIHEFCLVGRESEMRKLSELVTREEGDIHPVVYVGGMAGVGKSALVRAVYRRWIFDKYAWVNVCHPFNLMDFCRSIIWNMHPGSHRVADPIQECRKLLHRDRCLLVIDELQSKKDWDLIYTKLVREPSDWEMKLIRGGDKFRSKLRCIVVTTEERIVGHEVTSNDAVCNVPALQDGAALDLFRQVLSREMIAHVDEDMIKRVLEEEARLLLPNCGGLPSVLVALGRYLAHLHTLQRGIHEPEWKRLNANIMRELETNPEFDSLRGLFAKMHSNFHASPQHLKRCIFYLSIFPQNCIIRRRRLLRRWLAEGYSKGTDRSSLEEDAEKLVDKLVNMGVMRATQTTSMAAPDMRATAWQVNSFFLKYIISHQDEEKIFLPLEVTVLDGTCRLSTGRVGQHLTIGSTWEPDEFLFDSLDLSRLRSLTVLEHWEPFFISERMRVLRVLDLEGASNVKNEDIEQIKEKLPRLKFLSLRGCKEVSFLPDSLGDLRQLQTLDIRDTAVTKLPKGIIKLKKLQYIRAGSRSTLQWMNGDRLDTREAQTSSMSRRIVSYLPKSRRQGQPNGAANGVDMPRGIGRVRALSTLGVVNVSSPREEAILTELHDLQQLKKLQVSGISSANSRSMFLDFSCHLESLSVRGKDLPRGIKFPGTLMKLSLEMTTLSTPEDIEAIGKLKKLHTLRLLIKMVDDGLQFHANRLNQVSELKVLEIGCGSSLCVKFDDDAAKKLEQLRVHRPDGSSLELCDLQKPISLKQICIKGPCDDTLSQNVKLQIENHPKKPTLKWEE